MTEIKDDQPSLPKNYEPSTIEPTIAELWLETAAFHAVPDDRPPERRYVIMMPLPNVTGALHMGHALDNVMQDLLIRWRRMAGDNALWMPGTDHAGIATQAVVEKRLLELEGKTRHDLGREGLVERIWQWKDEYQTRIIAQQRRMGFSCDWDRYRFTMDDVCARAVRHTFFRMFGDGLIERGKRLVNWDVYLQTSVSDDEIYHETVPGHFWHLRYPVIDPKPGEPEAVEVATTRPETMLGDTAVACHPDPAAALDEKLDKAREALGRASDKDRAALEAEVSALEERKQTVLPLLVTLRDMALDGRRVMLPLMERPMPLILDTWAKPEMGSGCVKITPAHDPNDYDVWTRHNEGEGAIDIISVLNTDGTINDNAPPYAGLDRFAARDKVVADLEAKGLLGEVEDRDVEIGHSDRSKTPIEPYLSDQWYIRMGDVDGGIAMGRGTSREHRSPGLVQAAMDAVTDGRVSFHPERYAKTYLDWLSEKRDWPISRQLWWGHRIPVWARRISWGEIDRAALGAFVDDAGSRALCRVNLVDLDVTIAATDAALPGGEVPPEGSPCVIDVCLLEDDPELVSRLEGLGYERDPDVLDTWFSSALWPFSTLGWPDPATAGIDEGQPSLGSEGGADDCLDFYYPGSCLVTARDIITLWVARMVLAGLYDIGDIPFTDVFIHANILDGKGERMSKSKGNGIDPVDIIGQYGTDAMRYVLCEMQTGSQDIRLPVTAVCPSCDHHNDMTKTKTGKSIFIRICGKCGAEFDVLGTIADLPRGRLISERFDVGRAFCTKLWNSARFAFMNLGAGADATVTKEDLALEDRWILDELQHAIASVQQGLEDYNPSVALTAARDFFWNSLCDWYLELIKPRLLEPESATAATARRVLAHCLDQVLRLLHPFVPFITEHLWQRLGEVAPERDLGDLATAPPSPTLIEARWPLRNEAVEDPELRAAFADLQAVTRGLREVRASAGVSPRKALAVTVKAPAERAAELEKHFHVVEHLAAVSEARFDEAATRQPGSAVKLVGDIELFVHDVIDDDAERSRLKKERAKVDKEVGGLRKRVGNPKFVDKAPPEVVAEVRGRLAALEAQLEAIDRGLSALG